MEIYFLVVLTKVLLKYIFVNVQDLEKETELIFLLVLPTSISKIRFIIVLVRSLLDIENLHFILFHPLFCSCS